MKFHDFRQMSKVTFGCIIRKILNKMSQGRHRPPMVERSFFVRENENHNSLFCKHSHPFPECFDRIGDVFKYVGRNNEIVFPGWDDSQIGGIADILDAGRLLLIVVIIFIYFVITPHGVGAEIAIVQPDKGIERKQPSPAEDRRRSSNFQPRPTLDQVDAFVETLSLRLKNAPADLPGNAQETLGSNRVIDRPNQTMNSILVLPLFMCRVLPEHTEAIADYFTNNIFFMSCFPPDSIRAK